MRRLFFTFVIFACTQNFDVFEPEDDAASGSDVTTPTDSGVDVTPTDTGTTADTTPPPPDTGGICQPAACPGYRCVANACSTYSSCKEIHTNAASAPSAVYAISGDSGANNVYCDMTTDGGVWTLVARSGGSATSFGWASATGSVTDDTKPYSAGAYASTLGFTQILFGSYSTGKTWGASAFIYDVPTNLATCTVACAITTAKVAIGSCNPNGTAIASAFANVGFIARTTSYFFDATTTETANGLGPGGWNVPSNGTCNNGANLKGQPGMIFVR